MYIAITGWKKNEWVTFVSISLFLGLHLVVMRYPIIGFDSARYINAAFFLKSCPYALTLTTHLLKPLVSLIGIWGFAVFQIGILAYVLTSVLKFFNKNLVLGIIALTLSSAAFFAISVMMDIYTPVGLLALFLVLNRERDILLYIILSVCYVAHIENVVLFPFSALAYWLILSRKNFTSTFIPLIAVFIVPIICVFWENYQLDKELRFVPKIGYSMLAARIMVDYPEIARSYMDKYPASELAKHRKFYEYISAKNVDRFAYLCWDSWDGKDKKEGFAYLQIDDPIHKDTKEFIFFALKKYKFKLFNKNPLNSTFQFLTQTRYPDEAIDKDSIDENQKWVPFKLSKYSLQYQGGLSSLAKVLKLIYTLSFYVSFTIMLLSSPLKRSFTIFALITVLLNALIMSNFAGVFLRYQLRIMLIPCLATSFIIADFFKNHSVLPLSKYFNNANKLKIKPK